MSMQHLCTRNRRPPFGCKYFPKWKTNSKVLQMDIVCVRENECVNVKELVKAAPHGRDAVNVFDFVKVSVGGIRQLLCLDMLHDLNT